MKKTALIVALLLGSVNFSFAQEPESVTLRDLAISAMEEYASELDLRNDFVEARNVRARIAQLQADVVLGSKEMAVAMSCCEPAAGSAPVAKVTERKIIPVYEGPNADLKRLIAQEDQMLVDLNNEIDQLRTKTQSHE